MKPTLTRKQGRPGIPKREIRAMRTLKREGFSLREITEITDYSLGAVQKYVKGVK